MVVSIRQLVPMSCCAALLVTVAWPQSSWAQSRPTLNFGGITGLVDMPSAEMMPDGELTFAISHFGPVTRSTLSFQLAPRVQASFRYTGTKGLALGGYLPEDTYYDRSFDLRFQALVEGRWWPAVTIGLGDVGGNGLNSSEYIVATKTLPHGVRVTGGIGWGRLGSHSPFGSSGSRPSDYVATGGSLNADRWFRGDMAFFGGVEWQVNDRLGLKMEYSSDGYLEEVQRKSLFERKSSLNFGAEYQVSDALRLGAYYLYGSKFGLNAQFAFNPKRRPSQGIAGDAPLPVAVRHARSTHPQAWTESWAEAGSAATAARFNDQVAQQLAIDGVALQSMSLTANAVQVHIRNRRQDSSAQAIGRIARSLAQTLPSSVETFHILPEVNGVVGSRITLRRSDLERLEFAPNNALALRERLTFSDGYGFSIGEGVRGTTAVQPFNWSIGPYLRYSMFDPDEPVRADIGVRAKASYELGSGLVVSGSIAGRLAGNLDGVLRASNSVLPRVRTNDYLRDRRAFSLEQLQASWFARPGENLYSRVSVGLLERGYGGVSGELLWKPVDSRLALGVELNHVKQRSFTDVLGFEDYAVSTGHVSAYYSFDNGYHAQLDVGRYLAGDLGATLTLDREFANGWKVGAFATFTDVSFDDFGEGSFDKGIRLTVPLSWATGTARKQAASTTIRPIHRDGGARLSVSNRLYGSVREFHAPKVDDSIGRIWR